jgi:hypothetical protein
VYLHGKLPEQTDDVKLANLVVASGDYGRAYLSEGWAARFVSELLRNYVVCFVGYSLGDQTIRYLMDAVEVYKRNGEDTNPVYWFTESSNKNDISAKWSLVQIPYDPDAAGGNHAVLHKALESWAFYYKRGMSGKYEIVSEYANNNPMTSPDNGYVGQMLWALSDKSGKPLLHFATLPERPSFGWIKKLAEEKAFDGNLFSRDGNQRAHIFAKLVLRYADEPECLAWVIANQAKFFAGFYFLAELLCDGRLDNPKEGGIALEDYTERLWRLILAGKVAGRPDPWIMHGPYMEDWVLKGPLDPLKHARLVAEFTPVLKVEPVNQVFFSSTPNITKLPAKHRFSVELSPASEYWRYHAKQVLEKRKGSLWTIVADLSAALEKAFDAYEYLKDWEDDETRFAWQVPSIEFHTQNDSSLHELVSLVDLIREGWLELLQNDPEAARALAIGWLKSPHPAIKRFGLFAAKAGDVIRPCEWCAIFLEHCGQYLWISTVRREMMRLFAAKGRELSAEDLQRLTDRIMRGRPGCLKPFYSDERDSIQYEIFVRLGKLQASGAKLPKRAQDEFARIRRAHPDFELQQDESEEFVVFSKSGFVDPKEETVDPDHVLIPDRKALAEWLRQDVGQSQDRHFRPRDNFAELCRQHSTLIKEVLAESVSAGVFNTVRIAEAVKLWDSAETWNLGVALLTGIAPKLPEPERDKLLWELGGWCEDAIKGRELAPDAIRTLARLFFSTDYHSANYEISSIDGNDLRFRALNHPLGRVASGLIESCFTGKINKGDGIPEPHREIFTDICKTTNPMAWNARLFLAAQAIPLYYADEKWTREHLLPFASWEADPREANAFWQGYLYTHSLHVPLLADMKENILETFNHVHELAEARSSYISLLISILLLHVADFPKAEMENLIRRMDVKMLETAAEVVESYMERIQKAGGDVDVAWREDVWPLLHGMWPKDENLLSDETVLSLSKAALIAAREFGNGKDELWFVRPTKKVEHLLYFAESCKAAEMYPHKVLALIGGLAGKIGNGYYELFKFLKKLKKDHAGIENDPQYVRLLNMADDARNGIE